jgi:prevent-host-death family protein
MLEVPATEVAKRFSRYRQAAQREPVAVTHHSRTTEVLISKADYDEYMRLKVRATRALKVERLEAGEADLRKTVTVLERALSLKSATA